MYTCVCVYIYIYIYIEREREIDGEGALRPISVLRFWVPEGLTSGIILILRGGILSLIGNSPEMSSQAILAGIILAGRPGVAAAVPQRILNMTRI